MKRERWSILILLSLFAFTVVLTLSDRQLQLKEARLGLRTDMISSKGIAVLQLKGPISFSSNTQLMSPFSAESVLSQLDAIIEDKRVKGLLIRVNSPGGTVGASQELYQGILKFKEKTGCPVIVNTSFNVRGEPIVCSPDDAFNCFMGTHLDYLVIGNYVLNKHNQDKELISDYKNKYELD